MFVHHVCGINCARHVNKITIIRNVLCVSLYSTRFAIYHAKPDGQKVHTSNHCTMLRYVILCCDGKLCVVFCLVALCFIGLCRVALPCAMLLAMHRVD